MRSFFIISLSAALLSGCLTTQENPNYEYSTTYRDAAPAQTQHARTQYTTAAPTAPTIVSYESLPAEPVTVQANTVQTVVAQTTVMEASPTDSLYSSSDVTGTPGFMAMQNNSNEIAGTPDYTAMQSDQQQSVTLEVATQAMPEAEFVSSAPLGAAGTPIAYDYARNIVSIDSVTTGQQVPDSVRVIGNASQNYTVQQGDTVYSLSRKTCVGVNVIQSMNGLSSDYAIKIGQSLTLPSAVC